LLSGFIKVLRLCNIYPIFCSICNFLNHVICTIKLEIIGIFAWWTKYGNVVGIVESRLADIATLKTTSSLPQNVNYAVKSSLLSLLLESIPEISTKLKEPNPVKDRKFEDVVKETESAVALVVVYRAH
jgi:hypothetical protein